MAATIENPILNGPYEVPTRHFRFDEDGITSEIVEARRRSAYFMPIARPKKKSAQKNFETEWTLDRIRETTEVNRIRERVDAWRAGGYVSVTSTTRRLLEYWNDPERERKLFFRQREAAETAIYITEVAAKYGDAWIQNYLAERNAERSGAREWIHMTAWNPGLARLASPENRQRQDDLVAELTKRGFALFPGAGEDATGEWPMEHSVFIAGIRPKAARTLARKYGQWAIVAGELHQRSRLLWCLDPGRDPNVLGQLPLPVDTSGSSLTRP